MILSEWVDHGVNELSKWVDQYMSCLSGLSKKLMYAISRQSHSQVSKFSAVQSVQIKMVSIDL